MSSALVVLSGGQDSTTCLFWAKREFDSVRAVTFDYNQRHRLEIEAAMIIARMANVKHEVVTIPPTLMRSSSPLTSNAPLEQYENAEQMAEVIGDRIELTFVPMRNTIFLAIAMNVALSYGIKDIVTGVCEEDNANYPDCTAEYIQKCENLFCESLGDSSVNIHTPLIRKTKAQSVLMAHSFGQTCWEALAYSHTSYDGKYPPTDMNHANVLRAKGFEEANYPDPLVIRAHVEGKMSLPLTKNYDYYRSLNR